MQIVFDQSTLKRTGSYDSITGVVYFDFGGVLFPGERWDDFAVVLATWWLAELDRLERGSDREVELRFMDGPYWITVTRQDDNSMLLRCVDDRRDGGVLHEEHMELHELVGQVQRLARQVASACSRNGFESRDVDILKQLLPN